MDPLVLEDGYIYTSESDIYSVGMIIYYLAFGKPFITCQDDFLKQRNNFSMNNLSKIDKEIADIIRFCTKSKKPNEFSKVSISDFLKKL